VFRLDPKRCRREYIRGGTGAHVNLVQSGSARAASMQATQDDPHENAQGGVLNVAIALQKVAQPLGLTL
jgi:hypothetical protein